MKHMLNSIVAEAKSVPKVLLGPWKLFCGQEISIPNLKVQPAHTKSCSPTWIPSKICLMVIEGRHPSSWNADKCGQIIANKVHLPLYRSAGVGLCHALTVIFVQLCNPSFKKLVSHFRALGTHTNDIDIFFLLTSLCGKLAQTKLWLHECTSGST